MSTRTVYIKTALLGGTTDAVDGIDGDDLLDGDVCHAFVSNVLYAYLLDDDSGAAESSPDILAPDSNPGNKRWILQTCAHISDDAYAAGWDGDTTHAPSKNAVYDKIEAMISADFPDQDLNTTDDVEFNSVEAGGFNDLTLEALATGFSLAGGTTPKTLTVDASMTASTVNTAVGKAHEHSNKTDIDKIGTGGGGAPTWNSAAWPIDPRFDWMFAVEEIAGDHSGNITIDPSDGHRQSISIDGNITGLTCALSATYPSIILELTTDGAHTIDLTGDEQAGTVDDSDIGAVDAPASLTYEYDVTTLLTGDKFKVTLPTSAQSEAAADTFEYTLPADYDETDFLAAFNDDDNWTGTLDGTFSIVGDELVFTYDDDGEQADLAEAALAYTLVAWAWETDGGEAIVLPDNGKCIIVLSLGADNTTKYAFLAATDIEVPT